MINFESSTAPGPTLLAVPSLRLGDAEDRIKDYIDRHMIDWFIQEVLDPTKSIATSRKLSQRFIDALTVVKTGYLGVALALEEIWGPNQVPLHDLLEDGWGDGGYDIVPKEEGYKLKWTGGKYGPGIHFAPKVHHPGFLGYHIKDTVENWGFIEKFQQRIVDEATKYMESTRFI